MQHGLLLLFLLLAAAASPALSAPEPEPIDILAARDPDFARARQALGAKDWNTAIKALHVAEQRDGRNAEIQNLLGYAYRNTGQLDVAFKHYQRALQIDPRHRWAHEYIGETYLMMKDLGNAEKHLAALERICSLPCEEAAELKAKIAAYKKSAR